MLRNNAVNKDYPDGIFHAHKEYFFIKKEGLGLIEELGLFILPARLKRQIEQVKDVLSNNLDEKTYLEKYPDLIFCLSGHGHHSGVHYPFENGVPYFECASAKEKSYMLYTITRDSYDYELVEI